MKYFFYILTIPALFLFACSEEESTKDCDIEFTFTELTTDMDTISATETATITAVATGCDPEYTWQAETGTLLGEGCEVMYAASACSEGATEISCTVTNSDGTTLTKTITIVINP